MVIPVSQLIETLDPANTVLFFGSGSSIPSGAPSVPDLVAHFCTKFNVCDSSYSLREVASLAEYKTSRNAVIQSLRKLFQNVKPTGGLLNLPLYAWRSIFTTNYDTLIEQVYARRNLKLAQYSSNFDFTMMDEPAAVKLFKIHGTIEKDEIDGHRSRIILTESDYDNTTEYRDQLYDRLKSDMAGSRLVIIGHSLSDSYIRDLINHAASLNARMANGGQIVLFLYHQELDRAVLFEKRGFAVCFGGIDEFFAGLAQKVFGDVPPSTTEDPLDAFPALRPVTIDVNHVSDPKRSEVSAMFNGWPATHADILAGLTFERTAAGNIADTLKLDNILTAILLGASGVGKTTAARQALQRMRKEDVWCWEHKADHSLSVQHWLDLANHCREKGINGVLMVDEASIHLYQINELVERLVAAQNFSLKLLLIATRHQWNPRIKSPSIYRQGTEFKLVQLSGEEIDRLLQLVDICAPIRRLVEAGFIGFSRQERRHRLVVRCQADMFVCLKNIFASENFDDIILREYASLESHHQEIYRYVAAMENSGVRVHRQLIIRALGIPAASVAAALDHLTDIISEYTVDEREGIYGWNTRHTVIAGIITKYKFPDIDKRIELFDLVIDNLRPTYNIEIRTIRELCNIDSGIPSIPDKAIQNRLLRKLMSIAPAERVPRHRLIRNLISSGDYGKAETEIRIFENDFAADGPVSRYKISLLVSRAANSDGIMVEDRKKILETARALALSAISRFELNKALLSVYADLGVGYYRLTGNPTFFDDAINYLKDAEDRLGDPDISRLIARYMRRIQSQYVEPAEAEEAQLVEDQ